MRGGTLVFRDLFFVLLRRFFGAFGRLVRLSFSSSSQSGGDSNRPRLGKGRDSLGNFCRNADDEKDADLPKKIKKFCPTSNINLKSCLESFQNPTSEVGDFQSFLSISRWHGRTCNHETASKGEAKFPSPLTHHQFHSADFCLKQAPKFLFFTSPSYCISGKLARSLWPPPKRSDTPAPRSGWPYLPNLCACCTAEVSPSFLR